MRKRGGKSSSGAINRSLDDELLQTEGLVATTSDTGWCLARLSRDLPDKHASSSYRFTLPRFLNVPHLLCDSSKSITAPSVWPSDKAKTNLNTAQTAALASHVVSQLSTRCTVWNSSRFFAASPDSWDDLERDQGRIVGRGTRGEPAEVGKAPRRSSGVVALRRT